MRTWKQIRLDAGIEIFFCDPHAPGNAAPTKTPTASSGSTSPRAFTSQRSPKPSSTPSPTNSTTGPANDSPSPSPPSRSQTSCCNDRQHPPIRLRHWASWPVSANHQASGSRFAASARVYGTAFVECAGNVRSLFGTQMEPVGVHNAAIRLRTIERRVSARGGWGARRLGRTRVLLGQRITMARGATAP